MMAVCLIPLGQYPYSITGHLTFVCATMKSKLSTVKNPRDMLVHSSRSNVSIRMSYVNMHHTGCYLLEMVLFVLVNWLHWVMLCMVFTTFSCFCSTLSTWQNFHAKVFLSGIHENLFTWKFSACLFLHKNFPIYGNSIFIQLIDLNRL